MPVKQPKDKGLLINVTEKAPKKALSSSTLFAFFNFEKERHMILSGDDFYGVRIGAILERKLNNVGKYASLESV